VDAIVEEHLLPLLYSTEEALVYATARHIFALAIVGEKRATWIQAALAVSLHLFLSLSLLYVCVSDCLQSLCGLLNAELATSTRYQILHVLELSFFLSFFLFFFLVGLIQMQLCVSVLHLIPLSSFLSTCLTLLHSVRKLTGTFSPFVLSFLYLFESIACMSD
jgi:hypothetical protein